MIGVLASPGQYELVREFFELFKTPWEFYRFEGQYDVVLCAREDANAYDVTAKLVVLYATSKTSFDEEGQIEITPHRNSRALSYKGNRLPIYGKSVTIQGDGVSLLIDQNSNQAVGVLDKSGCQVTARIGYDLFEEIRVLLRDGQPPENASIPTVEIHIAVLRDLIVESGVRLVEIPPVPAGYTFTACLTHDIDHPSIRRHKWDYTMVGFVYRAVIGSLFGVLRGRIPVRHLLTNWVAVAKLPFIHLGLARDFWYDFDRYLAIENGLDSTFFVLPFKGNPGMTASGPAPRIRASNYGAADIAERLQTFVSAGREIGLHGIDAWFDGSKGEKERDQIAQISGMASVGVRMHWLYFDDNSPIALEKAGFSYDSTIGYNETVGYRAGTTQVFKLLQATKLLELPLHIMDTALFYPSHLNLTATEAEKQIGAILDSTRMFGGAVTINWHDRSIAAERLWGEVYAHLVKDLKKREAWCTSAGRAVTWFQQRRSVVFKKCERGVDVLLPNAPPNSDKRIPGLRVRVYNPNEISPKSEETFLDTVLTTSMSIGFPAGNSMVCQ